MSPGNAEKVGCAASFDDEAGCAASLGGEVDCLPCLSGLLLADDSDTLWTAMGCSGAIKGANSAAATRAEIATERYLPARMCMSQINTKSMSEQWHQSVRALAVADDVAVVVAVAVADVALASAAAVACCAVFSRRW